MSMDQCVGINCGEHPLEKGEFFCLNCEDRCFCVACGEERGRHYGHRVIEANNAWSHLE